MALQIWTEMARKKITATLSFKRTTFHMLISSFNDFLSLKPAHWSSTMCVQDHVGIAVRPTVDVLFIDTNGIALLPLTYLNQYFNT